MSAQGESGSIQWRALTQPSVLSALSASLSAPAAAPMTPGRAHMPDISGTLHSQEVHAQMLYPRNWCDFEAKASMAARLLWLRGYALAPWGLAPSGGVVALWCPGRNSVL